MFAPNKPLKKYYICGSGMEPTLEEAPFRWATQIGSCITRKHETALKSLVWDKYTSSLETLINYYHKKFQNIGPRA